MRLGFLADAERVPGGAFSPLVTLPREERHRARERAGTNGYGGHRVEGVGHVDRVESLEQELAAERVPLGREDHRLAVDQERALLAGCEREVARPVAVELQEFQEPLS